ncbi:hypothetical protein FACS1894107_03670 [Planctomycetales bacterium]|nr:hypothetical protein FACS1894107_03670 [Planctomycetales bacterium]
MPPISLDYLNALAASSLDAAARLDAAGWLVGADETGAAYFSRVRQAQAAYQQQLAAVARKEKIVWADDGVEGLPENFIAPEILATASGGLYAFRLTEALGFYCPRALGLLWGGCAFYDEERRTRFFLLRAAFRHRKKFLRLYSREELLAHETCHLARQPLADDRFEEFFAYQTSFSPLRRYLGSCFTRPADALWILLPSLAILAAAIAQLFIVLPSEPFFLALFLGAGYLLARVRRVRQTIMRAKKNLWLAGVGQPLAVLFRCVAPEILALAKMRSTGATRAYLADRVAKNFRWQVINRRFSIQS